ncbi:MAG: 3-dehydroquinate synthase [Kiritimatiellae bacterium]|nr:3-dehydroquinate synthase [Kiritimatiellia bacterium]
MNLTVELGDRSYPILMGVGILDGLGEACVEAGLSGRALIVTDSTVRGLYAARAEASLRAAGISIQTLDVPAGESSKDWTHLASVCEAALAAGLDRRGFIVALGGGVVGDLAGFAAAVWLRGIDFVQVPTTLLAMVDSAVGGKTGINLPGGKNLVGAFHQPRLVLSDLDVLRTLPAREFAGGMAEVVKYGWIRDADLLVTLERDCARLKALDPAALEPVVARCCAIKADVVARDEREGGLRAILNFGHTFGHALEAGSGYGALLHGEAVAIGMVFAARLSERIAGLAAGSTAALERQLRAFDLPVRAPRGADGARLRAVMTADKKSAGGRVRWVLAREPGRAEPGYAAPDEAIEEAWRYVSGE